MGGLGLTFEAALDQPMYGIERGYAARVQTLGALIGGGELPQPRRKDAPKPATPGVLSRPMSPALFDALFGG